MKNPQIEPDLTTALTLANPQATERLARAIAPHLGRGDVLGLIGDLGAGKSLLARALIAARLQRADEIPSPSFTLVQSYDLGDCELWHADLYRLSSPEEILELGLEEAFGAAICVVEWADRLGAVLPERMLSVTLDFVPGDDDARRVNIAARGGNWDWLQSALGAVEVPCP